MKAIITPMDIVKAKLAYHAGMSLEEFLEREIEQWKRSENRKMMLAAKDYYGNKHDILDKQRTVIGKDGQKTTVYNLPNNQIIDNQYAKLVDQKVNYLLSKQPSFQTENKDYSKKLVQIFNNRFLRLIRRLGEDSLNGGIAWLQVYYNPQGELAFKRCDPEEILPFWADADHTELDAVCRVYGVEVYEGREKKIIEKVEFYNTDGVKRYDLVKGKLITESTDTHFSVVQGDNQKGLNWERVPFVAFKYNTRETSLLTRIKSIQDAINTIISNFMDNMQEDARNTILVLVNYDGENLGEFRHNLSQYGAVKVRTVEGSPGDLKTLQVEVNPENYKVILDILKKALIENGRGLDAKSDKMGGSPNQMNIQSMYSDLDLDANGMENEYQAAFEELLWFINNHLANTGQGDYTGETVGVIFNRDVLINENETIDNCQKSVGVISLETIIANHPWAADTDTELKRLEEEQAKKQAEWDEYRKAFSQGAGIDEE